mmetsp:Transcript_3033/g.8670  ORF Transcript_3033/g.8670 Transcript_3033/m.8670 type:complete len:211 (-) Transcript_3033:248-880(-)
MQRQREVDGRRVGGQLQHPRDHPHGRDRDPGCREVVLAHGAVVRQRAQRGDHGGVVVQGLPHPHEHGVFHRGPPIRHLHGVGMQQLLDDLGRVQIADGRHRASGAEGAAHLTTNLGGDADRRAPLVAHDHRLHVVPVPQLEDELRGGAVGRGAPVPRAEARRRRRGEEGAGGPHRHPRGRDQVLGHGEVGPTHLGAHLLRVAGARAAAGG